jgi:hypothetical protein
MVLLSPREFAAEARAAGYSVVRIEQLRSNRLLMTLHDQSDAMTLVMVQARALIGAADVQDLAEITRLRNPMRAILLAHGGVFSATAHQTLAELDDARLRLSMVLPATIRPEAEALPGLERRPANT